MPQISLGKRRIKASGFAANLAWKTENKSEERKRSRFFREKARRKPKKKTESAGKARRKPEKNGVSRKSPEIAGRKDGVCLRFFLFFRQGGGIAEVGGIAGRKDGVSLLFFLFFGQVGGIVGNGGIAEVGGIAGAIRKKSEKSRKNARFLLTNARSSGIIIRKYSMYTMYTIRTSAGTPPDNTRKGGPV